MVTDCHYISKGLQHELLPLLLVCNGMLHFTLGSPQKIENGIKERKEEETGDSMTSLENKRLPM